MDIAFLVFSNESPNTDRELKGGGVWVYWWEYEWREEHETERERDFSHQCNALFHISPSRIERSAVISVHPPLNLISRPFVLIHTHTHTHIYIYIQTHIATFAWSVDRLSWMPVTLQFHATVTEWQYDEYSLNAPFPAESIWGPPHPLAHYCGEFV